MNLDNLASFLAPDFRVKQRDSLLEISRALTQELDLETLLRRILLISIDMLNGQAGLIALRSNRGLWGVRVSHGLTPDFVRMLQPVFADIPVQTQDEEGRVKELEHMNQRLSQVVKQASMGLLTGIGLPMITGHRTVGMIFIFRGYQNNFSQNDIDMLNSFANQAAIAVQNAQFYTQATRERQRLSALLDAVGDGILILTPDHKVERCNHAFQHLVGIREEDTLGSYHEELIRWRITPKGMTLTEAEAGGWPLSEHAQLYVEGDLLRFDNNASVPVGITYAPHFSEAGALQNIIVSLRDITRFRQADELKSTFISVISHELKTPVALIKGYTSTLRLQDADWDSEIVQESLEVIEEETDRLAELIENLLDASRFEAGGFKINRSDLSIPLLASKVCERFATQTEQHQITCDFPENFPVVMADENRIRQVLNNLVGNAIKYSPQGRIHISGEKKSNEVIISVTDEGPGIDPNDIPLVFDRFYRSPENSRQTKGAGLGLYLTRSIVEAHGGRIWVDTSYDEGARFRFSLPLDNEE